MLKNLLLIGAATAALGALSLPAKADNIVLNQWYAAGFTSTGSALGTAYEAGSNGPVLPSGFANGVESPAAPWVITLSHDGYLTVTDVEDSGDKFQMFDNGNPMVPTTGALGGQAGQAGGYTSNPCADCGFVGENIGAALGDANFSSGTFELYAGVNSITGTFVGVIGDGDMDFIAEAAPEPATLAVLGMGLAGLGLVRRRKR